MNRSQPAKSLAKMLPRLFPKAVRKAMERHKEKGGSCRIEIPPPEVSEKMMTAVWFKPGSMVALFKLGEDPAQIIWGEEIPGTESLVVCLRADGDLQMLLFDTEGNPQHLGRAPGAGPYDFGDLPVTEMIAAPGSRSSGKAVRERVNAAQRELLGNFQARVGSVGRPKGGRVDGPA